MVPKKSDTLPHFHSSEPTFSLALVNALKHAHKSSAHHLIQMEEEEQGQVHYRLEGCDILKPLKLLMSGWTESMRGERRCSCS